MNSGNVVHCICGPIAAGKSTLARELAAQTSGVRFAIDEWMQALYGPDRPARMGLDWVAPRVARCHEVIWAVAGQVLASGRDVVLEPGLSTRAEREAFRGRAAAAGHRVRMHFVDAPRGERLARLERRNRERGATFSFELSREAFDFMDARYEAPTADERADSVSVVETAGA